VQRATDKRDKRGNNCHVPVAGTSLTRAAVELVAAGESGVGGSLQLVQGPGHVRILGTVTGLTPGKHGFHVHAKGATGDNCKAAGGHFNPDGVDHSSPLSPSRHAGDLGNILADGPNTLLNLVDSYITLGDGGLRDVAGRGIVIHAGEDDLGRGTGDKTESSKKTGNAGARVACGVIKLLN